jgi:hypothetical protein
MATLEIDVEDIGSKSATALSIDEREQLYLDAAHALHINWRYFATFIKLEEEYVRDQINQIRPELLALKFHKLFKFVRGATYVSAPIPAATAATSTGVQIIRGVANKQRISEDVRLEAFMRHFMPGASHIRGAADQNTSYTTISVSTSIDIIDPHGSKYRRPGRYEFSALDFIMAPPRPNTLANKFLNTWRTGRYGAEYLANQIMWPIEYAFFTNNLAELDAKAHASTNSDVNNLPTLRINIATMTSESVVGAVDAITDLLDYAHGRHNAFYWAHFMAKVGESAADPDFDSTKYSTLFNVLRGSLAQTFNITRSADIVNVSVTALPAAWCQVAKNLGPVGEESARAGVLGLLFGAQQAHMATDWLFSTYLAFTESTTTDPISKRLLAILSDSRKQRESTILARKKKHEARLAHQDANITEQRLRFYYINKFGWDSYAKLAGAPCTASEDTNTWRLFEHIPTTEQKLINLLVKRDLDTVIDTNDNSTPWKKLVQELRKERDRTRRIVVFEKIKPYIKINNNVNKLDWIRSADGQIVMCPHIRDEIELEAKGKNTETELHEHLLKYAGNTPLQDSYYCSICGESMTYNDALSGISTEESAGSDAADGLRDFIWKQAAYLVKSQLEFKMASPEFINKFIGTVVSALFDTVALAERKLRRIKTNTIDDTDNQLKFYTALYVWAFMLKTVADNHTLVHFGQAVMGRYDHRANGGQECSFDIVDYVNDHEIVGGRENYDDDCEYEVMGDDFGLDKHPVDEMNNYYVNIDDSDDYFIRIIGGNEDAENVSGGAAKMFVPRTAADLMPLIVKAFMSIHNVLLQKLRDINEQFVQDQLNIAFRLVTNLTTRTDMKPMPPVDRETLEKIDPLFVYLRANVPESAADIGPNNRDAAEFQEYAALSHRLMHKYEEVSAGRQPVFAVSWTFLDTTATATVQAGDFWRKWRAEPNYLRMCELEARFNPYMRKIRHYFVSPQPFRMSNRYNDRPYPHWLMARTYGNSPSFHKHKWNKYVYVSAQSYIGDGKSLYKPAELIDALRMAPGMVIVDRICSICGELHSEMTKASTTTKKAGEWLENEETLVSFFNYYMQRCPELPPTDEAPFHVWNPDKCVKCNATKPTLLGRDLTYFKKYKTVFDKILADDAVRVTVAKAETASNDTLLTSVAASHWQDDTVFKQPAGVWIQEIAKLATLAAPSLKAQDYRNLWINMGLTEGLEYDDIKSGKLNPAQDALLVVSDIRIRKLISYIDELNFDINTIVNAKQMAEVHYELMHCISAIKKTESLSQFITISAEIDKIIDQYAQGELIDHPLDKLIQFLVKAHQTFGAATGNQGDNAQLFLRYFTRKIFNSEELAGKMRERRQAAVEASAAPDMRYDPNMQDHTESHSFDGLAQDADKYSLAHMDYNGHND